MAELGKDEITLEGMEEGGDVKKYITDTSNGVKIHPEGDAENYVLLDNNSFDIFVEGKKLCSIGYEEGAGASKITVDGTNMMIDAGEDAVFLNGSLVIANGYRDWDDLTDKASGWFNSRITVDAILKSFRTVFLALRVEKSTSTSAGGTIASGTIPSGPYVNRILPLATVVGYGGYDGKPIRMILRPDGSYEITNMGTSAVTLSSKASISLTYFA